MKSGSIFIRILSVTLMILTAGAGISSAGHIVDSRHAPSGYKATVEAPARPVSAVGPDVLLIQTALPWSSSADTTVLNALGYTYNIINMSEVATTDITQYKVVLIVNDQVQAFYDNYASNYSTFESYVKNGGVLVFFACDQGWNGGSNSTDLPGYVQVIHQFESMDVVADAAHPVVTQGLLDHQSLFGYPNVAVTNSDLVGTYCSHNAFTESTLPAGADVFLRASSNNAPTAVSYKLGNGYVIATGQTWEFSYDRWNKQTMYTTYAFSRMLPDIFQYAFALSGGQKVSGLNVNVYPDDNYPEKSRPTVWKAPGDLIDVVAVLTNNTAADLSGVTLRLQIDGAMFDPAFLYVYNRQSPEKIAVQAETEITGFTDDQAASGTRTITLSGLAVPLSSSQAANQYVFRLKLASEMSAGTLVDATATASGTGLLTAQNALSSGGSIRIVTGQGTAPPKIVLTNRELMYRLYAVTSTGAFDTNGAAQVNRLWQDLYSMAAKDVAVIYCIDKYDRDADGDRVNNPTISWFSDRKKLAYGAGGSYGYDSDPTTNLEETVVNQVALKIDGMLLDFLDKTGGHGETAERYVAILGGDAVIPFYRAFDTSKTVLKTAKFHNASSITSTDATNDYFFSDVVYRDRADTSWTALTGGNVNYVGRLTGKTAEDIRNLLLSSDTSESRGHRVVKLENNMMNCDLDDFEASAAQRGYTVIKAIGTTNIDVANPTGCAPYTKKPGSLGVSDPARWADFKKLFTGNDIMDFDIMRIRSQGLPASALSSETEFGVYFNGTGLSGEASSISSFLSGFNPFFIFDAPLAGQVDGVLNTGLLNSLLPLGVRGVIAPSAAAFTPRISRFNDAFTDSFLKAFPAGKALALAGRKWQSTITSDEDSLTGLSVNLFGLPWASISPTGVTAATRASTTVKSTAGHNPSGSATLVTRTIPVDASAYSTETWSGFDILKIDGFNLQLQDLQTPVLPVAVFEAAIPLDSQSIGVDVAFNSPVNLGTLNIPVYTSTPAVPDIDSEFPAGGYSACPTTLGVYPETPFTYETIVMDGYLLVRVRVLPALFNSETHAVTLYKAPEITISFSTTDQGIVSNYTSDKKKYPVNGTMTVRTTVENITSSAVSYAVTAQVLDITGTAVSNPATATQSIDALNTGIIPVELSAPASTGAYTLAISVTDGMGKTIGQAYRPIPVISGQISDFSAPTWIEKGSSGTFSLTYENLSGSDVTAYGDIYIFDQTGNQILKLAQKSFLVTSGSSVTVTVPWFPSDSFSTGQYYARAVVSAGNASYDQFSNSFTVAYPDNISLSAGWNLVSLYYTPTDTSIDTVLSAVSGSCTGVWTYGGGTWGYYTPEGAYSFFNNLSTMTSGVGYWINMTVATQLPIMGSAAPTSIDLVAGWNLVGFSYKSSLAVSDAVAGISSNLNRVLGVASDGTWLFYDPAEVEQSDLPKLEPGHGYWINVKADCTWTLP